MKRIKKRIYFFIMFIKIWININFLAIVIICEGYVYNKFQIIFFLFKCFRKMNWKWIEICKNIFEYKDLECG